MVKVTGRENAKSKISAMRSAELVDQVSKALFVGGNRIQVAAQQSITEGSVSGRFHVPSLPGEPPNSDTHGLDRQIETVQISPLKVEVSSNAQYAAHLEFGTSRMAARPYMLPASRKERDAVVKLVQDAVDRLINNRTK